MAGMSALLAVAYPTTRGNHELDSTLPTCRPAQALLGLSGGILLTTLAGYLDSQLFANILPVMPFVFAIGLTAWTVAGDEAAGRLELLLANPVSRVRLALARFAALLCLLTVLAGVCVLALDALAPSTGLNNDLTAARMAAPPSRRRCSRWRSPQWLSPSAPPPATVPPQPAPPHWPWPDTCRRARSADPHAAPDPPGQPVALVAGQ